MRMLIMFVSLGAITLCLAMPGDAGAGASLPSLEGIGGYIEGRGREKIQQALSQQGQEAICDAVAAAIDRLRSGEAGSDLRQLFAQDAGLRAAVQAEFKARLKTWLPQAARSIIRDDLLAGVAGTAAVQEAEAIAARVAIELDTTFNDRIDAIAGTMVDGALSRMREQIARAGMPAWVDPTDLRATIGTAFQLSTIADGAAGALAAVVGDGTVAAIQGRIGEALAGNLPPEAMAAMQAGPQAFEEYARRAQQSFPGNALQEFTSSILNRPLIKLPSAAYAGILAGTAAGHYARAFSGPVVDAYELQRAVEVTRVMVWQLEHKQWLNLTLPQLGSIARDLASAVGAGASFDAMLAQVAKPLEQLQGRLDQIDALLSKPLAEVNGQLAQLAAGLEQDLRALQAQLLAPLRDAAAKGQAGLDQAAGAVRDALPGGFNGLPASWDELKEKVGAEEGLLGKAGEKTPRDILRAAGLEDVADKVREDLAALNDRVAAGLAEGAAAVLEGAHLLGPAAAILDVERVPAEHPSDESALDPVLLHNGEFVQGVTDLVIPGRGIDFRFTRTYRGRSTFLGELGWRWTHSFAERLLPWNDGHGDGLTHIDELGRKWFYRQEGGEFAAPPGIDAKLARTADTGWVLAANDGVETFFDAAGRPVEKRDRYGNRLFYRYDDRGKLAAIEDVYSRRVLFERRSDGLVSAIQDFAGRRIAFDYNDAQELVGVRSPATSDLPKGRLTAYRYGDATAGPQPAHLLSMIMDPRGNVFLRNRYDAEGRVIAQRYGDGPWMTVQYAAGEGAVASRAWVTDQLGVTHLYEHDADGALLRSWRWEGDRYVLRAPRQRDEIAGARNDPRVVRNSLGQPLEEQDAQGRVVRYEYYPACDPDGDGVVLGKGACPADAGGGYLARIVRDGATTSFSYDPIGNIIAVTDPEGATTRLTVNALNQVVAEERPGAWPMRYAFDADDNLVRVEIERPGAAIVHRFEYDAMDRIILEDLQISAADRAQTRYSYDVAGRLVRVTKPEGNATAYEYDAEGRLLCEVRGAGSLEQARTCVERDAAGDVVARIDASGVRVSYELDEAGLPAAEIDALGNRREYGRDVKGRIIAARALDASGRLLAEERLEYAGALPSRLLQLLWRDDPASARWVEQRFSREAPIKDPAPSAHAAVDDEKDVRYDRDDLGRPVAQYRGSVIAGPSTLLRAGSAKQSSELITRFVWDKNGRLVKLIAPDSSATTFGYDALDRLVVERAFDGSERRTAYDGADRVTGVIDRNGTALTIAYDAAGRLASRSAIPAAGLAGTRQQRFGYDGLGRLVLAVDENDPGDPSDDALSRFVYDSLSRPVAEAAGERWIVRDFNDAGQVVATQLDGRTPLYFARDPQGLVSAAFAGSRRVAAVSRDAAGAVGSIDLGEELALEVMRDIAGRISSRRYVDSRNAAVAEWKMVRDAAGLVTQETDALAGVTRAYQRDAADRLVEVVETSSGGSRAWRYEYDPAGNPRMIASPQEYDANGNLLSADNREYRYDAFGRLTQVFEEGGLLASYRYDAFDRRIAEDVADIDRIFIWDGWQLAAQQDDDAGLTQFVALEGLGPPVAALSEEGTSYFIADRMGSVRAVAAAGGIRERCDYDPYGAALACSIEGHSFGFAGMLRSADGRLLYGRYRSYDPALMRFTTPDPLGIKMPMYAAAAVAGVVATAYHAGQGEASGAAIPNRPLSVSARYEAFPFGRLLAATMLRPDGVETNPYLYAGGDPSMQIDPLGLASLIFERAAEQLILVDGNDREITRYHAANNTTRPDADPLRIGGRGPFPEGTFALGVPEFYSPGYREDFYRRFGFQDFSIGESQMTGPGWAGTWKEDYNVSQGRIRIRVGAPYDGLHRVAWNRQLFIHGGRSNRFTSRTHGCIRARDDELETLAANMIELFREGDAVTTLTVRKGD